MQEEHPFRKINFFKSGENSFFHKDTNLIKSTIMPMSFVLTLSLIIFKFLSGLISTGLRGLLISIPESTEGHLT